MKVWLKFTVWVKCSVFLNKIELKNIYNLGDTNEKFKLAIIFSVVEIEKGKSKKPNTTGTIATNLQNKEIINDAREIRRWKVSNVQKVVIIDRKV